jgi:hypothetical protein
VLASVYMSFDDKRLGRNAAVQCIPYSRSCESCIRYLCRITESLSQIVFAPCPKWFCSLGVKQLIQVAASCQASVCGRSLAGVAGWNSAGGLNVCLVCCVFRPLRVVVRYEEYV